LRFSSIQNNEKKIKLVAKLTQSLEINTQLRQGSHLLQTLFINQIITEWKEDEIKGAKISRNDDIKTRLFASDQVVLADSKNAPQISIRKLETVTTRYGLKISISRTKTVAFKGRDQ
jgi:hypothetical protein